MDIDGDGEINFSNNTDKTNLGSPIPKFSERGALVINMAASKEKKARDIGMLKGMLEKEETLLVAGFNFQGLRVRTPASYRHLRRHHFSSALACASDRATATHRPTTREVAPPIDALARRP